MELTDIKQRIAKRLNIVELMAMQDAMCSAKLPGRLLLLAPTGSGKTLAFAIGMLRTLRQGGDGVKSLILVPTRELALQVYEVVRVLAAPEFKTAVFYGGHSVEAEVKSISGRPDIIVATPGRLLDHLKRGNLSLFDVNTLVLDEYDKSLELGFLPDMKSIAGRLRSLKTVILTSATQLAEVPDFIAGGAIEVFDYTSGADATTPDISLKKVESPSADKLETLDTLLRDINGQKTIVFVNHRDAADRVYDHLIRRGFPAGLYHGGLDQDKRERALILFANGTTPVLVSTDLASRGLDISGVDAVIHYHLPTTAEAMTHRNGRTGRMGESGRAFAIVSDADRVPPFMSFDDTYRPDGTKAPELSTLATIHFNVGKKEKISRGDIAGFLIKTGGLEPSDVGRIDLGDHQAYVAVPASKARATTAAVAGHKIKNTRVRVTQLKDF